MNNIYYLKGKVKKILKAHINITVNLKETYITPQKNTRNGFFPISELEKSSVCKAIWGDLVSPGWSGAFDGSATTVLPPNEDDMPGGYVCGVFEYIQGLPGRNWTQETSYGPSTAGYGNPVYWSTFHTKNVWTRSGDRLTFEVFENRNSEWVLVQSQVINGVMNFVYNSGRFRPGCKPIKISVNSSTNALLVSDDALMSPSVPTNGGTDSVFYKNGNLMVLPQGTYNPPPDPNCGDRTQCFDGRGSCEECIELSRLNGYRWLWCPPCGLRRQKSVLPGCPCSRTVESCGDAPTEFWADSGSYGPNKGTGVWCVCPECKHTVVPACATC